MVEPERRPGHDLELADPLPGDQRGQLDHQPGADIEVAVGQDVVEGEVVEVSISSVPR